MNCRQSPVVSILLRVAVFGAAAFGFAVFGVACSGENGVGEPARPDEGVPTYHKNVAPILEANCVSCHAEGGIAPFSLTTFEEASLQAKRMEQPVRNRVMPPWGADNSGDCQTYKHARWMSDDDINTVVSWIRGGAREGDPADAPSGSESDGEPNGTASSTATLVGATHSFDLGVTYTPDGSIDDDYRCFLVDLGNTEDAFVTGYEVIPGEPRVVHHAILYSLDTPEVQAEAEQLDADDPRPGYTCFGGPRVDGEASRFVLGWAPGAPPTDYPEGTGVPLAAGQKAVLQVHYNLSAGPLPDRTKVNLRMVDSVDQEAIIQPLADIDMELPPRMPSVSTSFEATLPIALTVHGVGPHMHELGTSLRVDLERDGGDTECVVSVPRWDFNWQQFYFYEKPIVVQPGDLARLTCTYNTTTRDEVVRWGDGTSDEMCLNYVYVTVGAM